MNKKQVKANILALFLGCMLVSCITTAKLYEGPELPQNKIAIVTMGIDLAVVTVDGVKGQGTMVLKMLPGKHTIALYYGDGRRSSTAPQSITFTAEAGKSYHISANASGTTWRPSIREVTGN